MEQERTGSRRSLSSRRCKQRKRRPSNVIDLICCINLQRRYNDRYLRQFVPMIQSTLLLLDEDAEYAEYAEEDAEEANQEYAIRVYKEEGKLLYDKMERLDAIDGIELMNTNNDNNNDNDNNSSRSSSSDIINNNDGDGDDNRRRRSRKQLNQELRQKLHTICCFEWDVTNNAKYDPNIRLFNNNIEHQQQQSPTSSTSCTSTASNTKRYLSVGEIGCIVSHVQLWKQLVVDEAAATNDNEKTCRSSSSRSNGNNITNDDDNNDNKTNQQQQYRTMLILEDDVIFYNGTTTTTTTTATTTTTNDSSNAGGHGMNGRYYGTNSTFIQLLTEIVSIVPNNFDILYLGFCHASSKSTTTTTTTTATSNNRPTPEIVAKSTISILTTTTTPRRSTSSSSTTTTTSASSGNISQDDSYDVHIFKPQYGFYTHAYIITSNGAQKLLQCLPITAPLDVWLADNSWFGLNVYVACIIEKSKPNSNPQPQQQEQSDPHPPDPSASPRFRRRAMSLISQRSPLHDSDIIHSAHSNY